MRCLREDQSFPDRALPALAIHPLERLLTTAWIAGSHSSLAWLISAI
jgi:hypothetical protein